MPSYADALEDQDRWDLVDYVYSLGQSDDPDYANLLIVDCVDDEIDVTNPELFDEATPARFPLVGQIVEPGRNFYPSTTSLVVEAVYNREEIAFRVRWNDMRAEIDGTNAPDLEVPLWDDQLHAGGGDSGADEEAGGFWGAEEEEEPEEDFWGEEEGGDFWGEEEDGTLAADKEFSDAVALQFPSQLPAGVRKPYFIFGDAGKPVDLWFFDLARDAVQQYKGYGSDNLEPVRDDDFEVITDFDSGRWTVTIKRELEAMSSLSFETGQLAPIAFSVWDGFNRERGNKRALSAWFHLYMEPLEVASSTIPMIRAGLITLLVEIILVVIVRRRFGKSRAGAGDPSGSELSEPQAAT